MSVICVFQALNQVVRVGLFCVAPFMDETLEYYRAKIHAVERRYDERLRAHRDYVEVGSFFFGILKSSIFRFLTYLQIRGGVT